MNALESTSEFSIELDQIIHAALSHSHLDSLQKVKQPPQEKTRDELVFKMDTLLDKIQDSQNQLTSNIPFYKSNEFDNTLLARNANAISRQIELVDRELESIKNQVSLSFQESSSIQEDDRYNQNQQQGPKELQDQKKSLDPNRFDAIPSSIKAYIRQEILLLESKLPSMIETALDKMLAKKIKIYMDKYSKSRFELNKRPPWNEGNTLALDKDWNGLTQVLANEEAKVPKKTKKAQLLHTRATLSTQLKQQLYNK